MSKRDDRRWAIAAIMAGGWNSLAMPRRYVEAAKGVKPD